MKLPESARMPVQSLGRDDVSAPAREFAAEYQATQALTGAVQDTMGVISGIYQASQEEDARQRAVDLKKQIDMAYTRAETQPAYDLDDADDRDFIRGSTYATQDAQGNPVKLVQRSDVMAQVWGNQRDKIIEKGLEGMSKGQKQLIRDNLQEYINNKDVRMAKTSTLVKNDAMRKQVIRTAQSQVDAGDLGGALQSVTESLPFTTEERIKTVQGLQLRHEQNKLTSAIRSEDPSTVQMEINRLDDEKYSGVLSENQRQAGLVDLRRRQDDLFAGAREASAKAYQWQMADTERDIREQKIGMAQIESMRDNGDFRKASDYTKMANLADRVFMKGQTEKAQSTLVADARAQGLPVDPNNNQHTKAVDDVYLRDIEQIPETNGRLVHGAMMATDMNYPPKAFESLMVQMTHSDDPKNLQTAADVFGAMIEKRPSLANQFDESTRTLLTSTYVMSKGMPDQQGAQIAFNNSRDVSKEERVQILKQYPMEPDRLQELADESDMDISWFSGAPAVTTAMMMDFNKVRDDALIYTRNPKLAETIAWNSVRSRYNTSGINDDTEIPDMPTEQIMAYPPEMDTGMPPGALRENLEGFLTVRGHDIKDVFVRSDDQTARDRNGGKTYSLLKPNKSGILDVIWTNDNQILRWQPNKKAIHDKKMFEATEQRAEKEAYAKKYGMSGALEKVRIDREARERAAPSFTPSTPKEPNVSEGPRF